MYAFQEPPTGLETHATAIMNPVYESHESPDSRHRVSVGVLPTVVVKVINPIKPNKVKLNYSCFIMLAYNNFHAQKM